MQQGLDHSCFLAGVLQGRWLVKGRCVQRVICQIPGDCDLIFGSLLLKGEHFILLFTHRGIKVQRLWQRMGTALPRTAFPPADPFRLGVAQPLVFCFLFHPLLHIILFSSVSFLTSLALGPSSSQMGGTGFTLPASADSEPPRFPLGL